MSLDIADRLDASQLSLNDSGERLNSHSSARGSASSLSASDSVIFAATPTLLPPVPNNQGFFGPYLRYLAVSYTKHLWYGNAMIVSSSSECPSLTVFDPLDASVSFEIKGIKMAGFSSYSFYRYHLQLPLSMDPQSTCRPRRYVYYFNGNKDNSYSFHVASTFDLSWNWAFHSCNGWSSNVPVERRESMGGLQPLWTDLLKKHADKPILVLAGGGDQVYADAVWKLSSLQAWLKIKGRDNRMSAKWTEEMEMQVNEFYLNLYLRHFSEPVICDALASIPAVNTIDDHDLFDGLGSYPDWLEACDVFQNIRRVAMNYFLLFQQQTTVELASKDVYIGVESNSYSFLRLFGHQVAILGVDARAERTQKQVVSPATWEKIFSSIEKLPPTVKHLVIVTGVPLVYPRMEVADSVLENLGKIKRSSEKAMTAVASGLGKVVGGVGKLLRKTGVKVNEKFEDNVHSSIMDFQSSLKKSLGKTGAMKSILNQFGLPELSDDLNDHWTHASHMAEREFIILRMQQISQQNSIRVSFLAGDVHCAAVGRLFNSENPELLDNKLMYQIVSSAIGNVPPPNAVLKSVNSSAKTLDAAPGTKEDMIELFINDVDGSPSSTKKVLGRRNYCLIGQVNETDPNLQFSIQVEDADYSNASHSYIVAVPAMVC